MFYCYATLIEYNLKKFEQSLNKGPKVCRIEWGNLEKKMFKKLCDHPYTTV
jgi:hypothetical protein